MTGSTALVIGGGGSTGNAWAIGVLAGLADAGMDAAAADLIVGTSAGATTAAQVTARSASELLAEVRAASAGHSGTPATAPAIDHTGWKRELIAASTDAADYRRRIGQRALAAADPTRQERWRATVAARLSRAEWPERTLQVTAVDAETGEAIVFDRHAGVDLADAVAASCSSGFAYGIRGRWFIDGGYRTNADNADLAAGYERVLVLSPLRGQSLTPVGWGLHLDVQVEALRSAGSRVTVIMPDAASDPLFGNNAMDAALRTPAAELGYAQGQAAGTW